MCKEFGYHVQELKRVRIMNIRLGHLKTGTWRNVTEAELVELYRCLEDAQMEAEEMEDVDTEEMHE